MQDGYAVLSANVLNYIFKIFSIASYNFFALFGQQMNSAIKEMFILRNNPLVELLVDVSGLKCD